MRSSVRDVPFTVSAAKRYARMQSKQQGTTLSGVFSGLVLLNTNKDHRAALVAQGCSSILPRSNLGSLLQRNRACTSLSHGVAHIALVCPCSGAHCGSSRGMVQTLPWHFLCSSSLPSNPRDAHRFALMLTAEAP